MLENRMLIDSEWNEIEYGVPVPREFDPWEGEDMDSEWDEDLEDDYE